MLLIPSYYTAQVAANRGTRNPTSETIRVIRA